MKTVFICENCGNEVTGTEDHDGFMTVEQHYECSACGFRRHWAYGNLMPDDSEYEEEQK